MALQLFFNGIMTVFFIYCFFYVGSIAPEPQPGLMDGAQWPQLILGLLVVMLIVNMVNIYRRTPKEERNLGAIAGINWKGMYKNKLFIGIVLVFAYAILLPYTGFILTSFLFAMAYCRLLGEKRLQTLLLFGAIVVVALYLIFGKGLGIMLPRGVGFLRDFALMLETI